MCSQNVRVAELVDGTATCWYSESVWVVPYPSSQAFHAPEWAGSAVELSITPAVATHGDAVPVSNPGLPRIWPPPPPPPLVTMGWVSMQPPVPELKSLAHDDWTANVPVLNVMFAEAPCPEEIQAHLSAFSS